MTGPLQHPTSELVAQAWIAAMTPIPASAIATQLPQDNTAWTVLSDIYGVSTNIMQFVTVRVVGGTPQENVPIAHPIIEVTCFATKPTSNKPPWFAANQTLELIRLATYNRQLNEFGRALNITQGNVEYNSASVISSVMHTEPRRLYSDAANYALYQADMSLCWREVGYSLQ
jgi:hypothetical protein